MASLTGYIQAAAAAALWIYILSVTARAKLPFFKFLIGTAGTFFALLLPCRHYVTPFLSEFASWAAGSIGKLFGFCEGFPQHSILFVNTVNGSISLYVDYECAGVIEILVFVSLVMWFPALRLGEKIVTAILGTFYTLAANVLRLIAVCAVISHYGPDSYYIAHTVVGRLIFYGLTVFMYYEVFTKTQIKRQKVGNFSYDKNSEQ